MNRIYVDTEFNGFGGELISFALVPEDSSKQEIYLILEQEKAYQPWVLANVIPHLGDAQVVDRERAGRTLAAYLRMFDNPVLVADWPEDLTNMLNLLLLGGGMMVATPDFSLEYRNFRGFSAARDSKVPHNALWDARALRDHVINHRI